MLYAAQEDLTKIIRAFGKFADKNLPLQGSFPQR
jgi:hypothetical protein